MPDKVSLALSSELPMHGRTLGGEHRVTQHCRNTSTTTIHPGSQLRLPLRFEAAFHFPNVAAVEAFRLLSLHTPTAISWCILSAEGH